MHFLVIWWVEFLMSCFQLRFLYIITKLNKISLLCVFLNTWCIVYCNFHQNSSQQIVHSCQILILFHCFLQEYWTNFCFGVFLDVFDTKSWSSFEGLWVFCHCYCFNIWHSRIDNASNASLQIGYTWSNYISYLFSSSPSPWCAVCAQLQVSELFFWESAFWIA